MDGNTVVPGGFHSVPPRMVVSDVAAAVDFLQKFFHAVGDASDARPAEIAGTPPKPSWTPGWRPCTPSRPPRSAATATGRPVGLIRPLNGSAIVGFVASTSQPGRPAKIDDVQVHPAHQRRGIASMLLHHNLSALATRGNPEVRLQTEGHDPAGALSLYRRLGFSAIGEYQRFRKPAGPDLPPMRKVDAISRSARNRWCRWLNRPSRPT